MTKKENDAKLREMKKALRSFPAAVRRQERAYKEEMKIRKAFGKLSLLPSAASPAKSVHPWRLCPFGQFYRKGHPQKAYVKKNGTRSRESIHPNECVTNKTGKDQLYAEEIQEIAKRHFAALTKLPTAKILSKYPHETSFDTLIAGWTKYWNEIIQPVDPLEPNFVKALITSESGFRTTAWNGKKGLKRARGLMQVTDETVKLLSYRGKELKDHFVNLKEDDMLDPNLTICAGIRWLFRKREIAESRTKDVTWAKVVMLYKNYSSLRDEQMRKFLDIYEALESADKAKLKDR